MPVAIVLTILALVALAARAFWAPAGPEDATWARCQREGILRIGMDASYPPFEVEEGGEFRGYDVDLAREICRRLGLRPAFVNVGFDGLYDALAAGRCDALISGLPYDGQRTPDVFYTGGYYNAGQVLVARREDAKIETYRNLDGCEVAVEMGSAAHQEALRLRDHERIALTIVAVQTGDGALDLVQSGDVEAAIADSITARLGLRSRPDLTLRGPALSDESYVIAVRRDSPQLYAAVKGVLDGLRGEGWLDHLAGRWLDGSE
ncbi:MAG: transporter substrate-binding domain-containing protein [Anaerolineae bacterium]|nr:transporter substrate-binding domain-containing protein [Anaerolineae bacterium]